MLPTETNDLAPWSFPETRRSRIIVPTENPNDPRYIVQPGMGLDGVVGLGQGGLIDCTGTLLYTGRHILTAAHCFNHSDGTANLAPDPANYRVIFNLPSGRLEAGVKQVFIHPEWTADFDNNNDIAIIELSQTVPETVDRYKLYSDFDEVGQVFTKVGYGVEGTGQTGENFTGLTSVKRMGQNRYDASSEIFNNIPGSDIIPNTQLAYDFDNGLPQNDAFGREYGIFDLGLGVEEIGISGGDSGAPAFIQGKIAGISSFGQNPAQAGVNLTPANDTSFGEFFSDTRVSAYVIWVEQMIAQSNQGDDFIQGTNARHDFLNGNQGNDTLVGLAQDDTLFGGQGNDEIEGNEGGDFLSGNRGNDLIDGNLDRDQLFGGQGNDTLIGGSGEDTLRGDLGQDLLRGDSEADLFILSLDLTVQDPEQADQILDFTSIDFLGIVENLPLDELSFEPSVINQIPGLLVRQIESNAILGFVHHGSPEQLQSHFIIID